MGHKTFVIFIVTTALILTILIAAESTTKETRLFFCIFVAPLFVRIVDDVSK